MPKKQQCQQQQQYKPCNEQGVCDQSDYQQQQQINIQKQVQSKIKQLPSLQTKIHCIAINNQLILKRKLDQSLQKQTQKVQRQYRQKFKPYIDEMNKIICGQYNFIHTDFQQVEGLLTQDEKKNVADINSNNNNNNNINGNQSKAIPEYWLKVFLNSQILGEQVMEKDQPILKYLYKIQAEKAQDLSKLSVHFYFNNNQWFSNNKLSKHFDIQQTEIKKSYGDEINWKQGKNITIKIVKKKGKKGGKKTKQVKQKSFFNFFKSVQPTSDDQDNNDHQSENQQDQIEELQLQYEIAQTLYEDLIPKSLEYYLDVVSGLDGEFDDGEAEVEEVDSEDSAKGKSKSKGKKNKRKASNDDEDDQ